MDIIMLALYWWTLTVWIKGGFKVAMQCMAVFGDLLDGVWI